MYLKLIRNKKVICNPGRNILKKKPKEKFDLYFCIDFDQFCPPKNMLKGHGALDSTKFRDFLIVF